MLPNKGRHTLRRRKVEESLPYSETLKLAHQFYISIDTPRALTCHLLLQNNEIDQLVNLSCEPKEYTDHYSYLLDSSATNLLRKFCFQKGKHGSWRSTARDAAEKTLLSCEANCRKANDRIFSGQYSQLTREVLFHAKQVVRSILGTFKPIEWVESCRFGPGADLLNKSDRATVFDKLTNTLAVTPAFYSLAKELVGDSPSWASVGNDIKPVWNNRITFVPKDAKTDRPIAIEPGLNAYAQAGIGAMIRRRLHRSGNSIESQHLNQLLAEWGSKDGYLATVDLSSASDTVCYALVMELLPSDWFHACDLTRSPFGMFPDGRTITYEKFSSMGNGYTFELETLLFLALSTAVQRVATEGLATFASVYGDDIIVPSSVYTSLVSVFSELGFSVNVRKSYAAGNFRESCGMDYYRGFKVRSYYLKEALDDIPSVNKAANSISRLAFFLGYESVKDARLEKNHAQLRSLLRRLSGARPLAVGPFTMEGGIPEVTDSYLAADLGHAMPWIQRLKWGHDGWSVVAYRARARRFRFEERHGDLATALYLSRNGTPDLPTYGVIPVRQSRPEYVRCRQAVHEWLSLGPWA